MTSDVLESGRGWVEVPIRLATGKHLVAGALLGRYRQRGLGQLVAMFKETENQSLPKRGNESKMLTLLLRTN